MSRLIVDCVGLDAHVCEALADLLLARETLPREQTQDRLLPLRFRRRRWHGSRPTPPRRASTPCSRGRRTRATSADVLGSRSAAATCGRRRGRPRSRARPRRSSRPRHRSRPGVRAGSPRSTRARGPRRRRSVAAAATAAEHLADRTRPLEQPVGSIASITASAPAQTIGPPPNVDAWSPGSNEMVARASIAPIGSPPPRALARVRTSASTPACCRAAQSPQRPETRLHLVGHQQGTRSSRSARTPRRYASSSGRTPPRPSRARAAPRRRRR